jgi:hypothetical protein
LRTADQRTSDALLGFGRRPAGVVLIAVDFAGTGCTAWRAAPAVTAQYLKLSDSDGDFGFVNKSK